MKAWLVGDRNDECREVVFAPTRGQAKALALSTDCCEFSDFVDITARRAPMGDKYYTEGKWHMDWFDRADRIALVKDMGFVCSYDWVDFEDCPSCCASAFCDLWQDHERERGEKEDAEEH